jgi:hypothetical protein
VGEEQGPWWTQPPAPSAPPPEPPGAGRAPASGPPNGAGEGGDGESRGARFRARVRRLQEGATGEVPTPRGTAPADGAGAGSPWDALPFEPSGQPYQPAGQPPGGQTPYPTSSLASPPQPPPAPTRPQPPGSAAPPPGGPGDPMVVDLRHIDDPHDPLSGTWGDVYGDTAQAHAGQSPGDRTEQLPRVGEVGPGPDDALGVYGAPSRVAPGIPGLTGDADPVGHLRGLPGASRLPAPLAERLAKLPGRDRLVRLIPTDPRTRAVAGGVVAVLLVVLVVRVATGGGDGDAPPPTTQASAGQAAAGTPKDFAKVSSAAAVKDLKLAGENKGEVVGAWRWSDRNGRNLLATTRERSGANQTLRVIHVARLDKDPKSLRVMIDPGLPGCGNGAGAAAFTKNSVRVRDLDKNGVAEVLVGWFSRCGSASAESTVKLALLSNGDKYILRGEGVIGSGGSQAPDPAAKSWPKPFLKTASAAFKDLYF